MTQVRPGDLVFSFAGGRIIAIGLAVSASYEAPKPTDFGAAGQSWSADGWAVDVDFQKVPKPLKPLEHMHVLYPLLPPKYSPLRANGQGKELYLTSIPIELRTLLLELIGSPELAMQVTNLADLSYSEEEQLIVQDAVLEETMKASLVLARRGQGKFRKRVAFFEGSCRVTGVSSENLLIASHIKPWASSSNEERLNGHNGLFLSPHIDKLFDTGLMSFENNGAMLFSESLDLNVLERWSIDPTKKVKKFGQDQSYFLAQHRENVFK
jgi:hypothetical protein